jgi:D-amino-acid dehydrogenase
MTTLVIGAGIIGTAIAYTLQKRGHEVTLIDRDSPGKGTSFGNLASIAVTEFMPASRPAIWRQIPGWMLDPEGPIRIRPAYAPRLIPWFARFIAASRPKRLREIEAQNAALCLRALDDWQALLGETGLQDHISGQGCLSLYAGEAEFNADRDHIALLERFNLPHEVIGRQAIKALEPELSDDITLAVLFPQNRTIRSPFGIVTALADRFTALGGRIEQGTVMGFTRSDAITGVILQEHTIPATKVILCAGAHTAALAKLLGEPIPLETERGYHTQIMAPGITMNHSIIWPSRAFMVSPTAGGIRVGGTVEFGGLTAAPDYRRAKITVKRAKEALPNLQVQDATEWMGHRPALPDTVPIISASARTKGLYYATGHGHLGLTQAATTARLMADLVTGTPSPIDLHPYRINRF